MRFLRSFACIAIAMCASVLMTVPSVAAVPIDPGISVMAQSHEAYPAPTIATVDHAALTCETLRRILSGETTRGCHPPVRVNIDGVMFASYREAARQLGQHVSTIIKHHGQKA